MNKKIVVTLVSLINLINLFNFISPPSVLAQPKDWPSIVDHCTVDVAGEAIPVVQGFECVVYNISTVIIPFAGIAVFFMLIIGAIKLMTSGGEPKQIQSAWKTITFAVVGIIVILAVWFIIQLLIYIFGTGQLGTFEVPMWVP